MKNLFFILLSLIFGLNSVSAYAWNSYGSRDDYSSTGRGVSLNDFRQQMGYEAPKVEVQQSWFSKAWQGVSNFFSGIKDFAVSSFNFIKDVTFNAFESIKSIFVKTPDIDTSSGNNGPPKLDDIQTNTLDNGSLNEIEASKETVVEDLPVVDTNASIKDDPVTPITSVTAKEDNQNSDFLVADESSVDLKVQEEPIASEAGAVAQTQAQEIKEVKQVAPVVQMQNIPAGVIPVDTKASQERMLASEQPKQAEPKQESIVRNTVKLAKDTANEIKQNWDQNHNSSEAFSKGFIDNAILSKGTTIEDSHWAHQRLAFKAEEGLNSSVGVAYDYYNNIDALADQQDNKLVRLGMNATAKTGKALTFIGSMAAGTVIDVCKFGTEINQIARSYGEAKANFAMGKNKEAWRAVGQMVGGVTKEAGRVAVVFSAAASVKEGLKNSGAKNALKNSIDDGVDDISRGAANKVDDFSNVKYGAHDNGPLHKSIAKNFRGASYTEKTLTENTTLYRVYGNKAGKLGSYWTRNKPHGPLQSQLDSALVPKWGNSAAKVVEIKVPKGTKIFEGYAAPQSTGVGEIIGGGSQIYIKKVDPSWLVE